MFKLNKILIYIIHPLYKQRYNFLYHTCIFASTKYIAIILSYLFAMLNTKAIVFRPTSPTYINLRPAPHRAGRELPSIPSSAPSPSTWPCARPRPVWCSQRGGLLSIFAAYGGGREEKVWLYRNVSLVPSPAAQHLSHCKFYNPAQQLNICNRQIIGVFIAVIQ